MKPVLLIFLLYLCSCSKDTFPKYIELNDLRVVALQTTTPEVAPGATVAVTPYVSDVNNTGPLSYTAQGCIDLSYGTEPSCDGNSTAVSLGAGSLTLAAPTYTGAGTALNLTVPATILAGRSTADSYNGVNYLVTYAVTNTAGKTVKSFRRIVVSSKATKNLNPSITDILANGAALGPLAEGADYTLSMTTTAASAETYSRVKSTGETTEVTEDLSVTWFISDGSMKYYRTSTADANVYTAPASYPTSRGSFILVVVRDGRGGLDLRQISIH